MKRRRKRKRTRGLWAWGGGYCMRVSALVIWRILHKRAAVWDVIDKGWAQGKGVLVEWEGGGGRETKIRRIGNLKEGGGASGK